MSGSLTISGSKLLKAFENGVPLIRLQQSSHDEGEADADGDFDALQCEKAQDDIRALVQALQVDLHRRPQCPVALGSGRASVCHKVHAEVPAMRLEHHTWQETVAGLQCVSRLTDQGVESGMVNFPCFRPTDLFPWAAADAGDFDVQDDIF